MIALAMAVERAEQKPEPVELVGWALRPCLSCGRITTGSRCPPCRHASPYQQPARRDPVGVRSRPRWRLRRLRVDRAVADGGSRHSARSGRRRSPGEPGDALRGLPPARGRRAPAAMKWQTVPLAARHMCRVRGALNQLNAASTPRFGASAIVHFRANQTEHRGDVLVRRNGASCHAGIESEHRRRD